MAYTDIQICNLALSRLGDIATVANISAPTTPQEKYCATFYPLARDITLEKHTWAFATVRAALVASSTTPPSTWQYAYNAPANLVNCIAVIDPNAGDDYSASLLVNNVGIYNTPMVNVGAYTPTPFEVEQDGSGTTIIYSNVQNAVLRYTVAVTDPSKWPTTFIDTLSYRLAAMLAGLLIKGDVGTKMSQAMEAMADRKQQEAEGSDANSRSIKPNMGAPWMQGRS